MFRYLVSLANCVCACAAGRGSKAAYASQGKDRRHLLYIALVMNSQQVPGAGSMAMGDALSPQTFASPLVGVP